MSELDNPNRRISEASRKGETIATLTSTSKGCSPEVKKSFKQPMPGIVILVHGVNDIGEAYPTQAEGLCAGLNLRLSRDDIDPGQWDVSKACPDNRVASYTRSREAPGNNPIIPFYWGYRPVDKATYEEDQKRYKDELDKRGKNAGVDLPYDAYYIASKGQPQAGYENTDNFHNWLNDHYCKNGGVFANATTNLADMWGPGGKIFGLMRWASSLGADNSHAIYENPHRIYYVWAAQRLANLIIRIRSEQRTKNDSINLIGHSQGTLVSMLANFLVVAAGERPADCLILKHSPYSLEEPLLEALQNGPQQSARARRETLINLCKLIDAQKLPGLAPDELLSRGVARCAVAGKADHLRDNHGKVFNYFCPHDRTVSLLNVQGIGWKGIPEDVAGACGPALNQRMFADGRAMATPPGVIKFADLKREGFKEIVSTVDIPTGESRNLNAPALPDFGYTFKRPEGCDFVGGSDFGVTAAGSAFDGELFVVEGPLKDPRPGSVQTASGDREEEPLGAKDLAEIADLLRQQDGRTEWVVHSGSIDRVGRIKIVRYMTQDEVTAKVANTKTVNSHHSAMVLDVNASKYAAAFDLAIGRCKSYDPNLPNGGPFWERLVRMADWRLSREPDDVKYYKTGELPREIKTQMSRPLAVPGVLNEIKRVPERLSDSYVLGSI